MRAIKSDSQPLSQLRRPERGLTLGVLTLVLAFLVGTIQNALIKLVAHQVPISMVLFVQYAVCLGLCLPQMVRQRQKIFRKQNSLLLCLRAVCGLGYFFCMFYALRSVPLTDVALLTNTAPLWVPFICFFALGQRIQSRVYALLIIGFVGVGLILMPDGYIATTGSLFALLGGVLMAVSLVATKELTSSESVTRVLVYYFGIATLVMLVFSILHWHAFAEKLWLVMLLNGLLMLLQQILVYRGFTLSKSASRLSIATYSAVVFSVLLDWLIWEHVITAIALAGMAMIVFATSRILLSKQVD